jgi:hypothetical protein
MFRNVHICLKLISPDRWMAAVQTMDGGEEKAPGGVMGAFARERREQHIQ